MKINTFLLLFVFFCFSEKCLSQELSMYPGFWKMQYYQDDNKLSKQEFVGLIMDVDESAQLWKKSNKQLMYAWVAFGAQLGFLAWQINRRNNRESMTAPIIGGLGSAIVGIGFAISSGNLKKKAILRYNKSKDIGSINFGPTYNGMGLVLNF